MKLELELHCTEEADIREDRDMIEVLRDFVNYKGNVSRYVRYVLKVQCSLVSRYNLIAASTSINVSCEQAAHLPVGN